MLVAGYKSLHSKLKSLSDMRLAPYLQGFILQICVHKPRLGSDSSIPLCPSHAALQCVCLTIDICNPCKQHELFWMPQQCKFHFPKQGFSQVVSFLFKQSRKKKSIEDVRKKRGKKECRMTTPCNQVGLSSAYALS